MKTNDRSTLIPFLCLLLLVQACTTARKADKKTAKVGGSESPSGSMEAGLPGAAEVTEASLRGKTFQSVPTLASVHFAYDRDSLDGGAMAALKANAEWLKANSKVEVQIQGHCDERGTVAYNLALGQKRSRAVRDYYRALGVPMSRMSTISFGKEKPDCPDATEECWRANRRAETRARVVN